MHCMGDDSSYYNRDYCGDYSNKCNVVIVMIIIVIIVIIEVIIIIMSIVVIVVVPVCLIAMFEENILHIWHIGLIIVWNMDTIVYIIQLF